MAAYTSVNRIAFIDRNGQLSTIAPDGSERRILTAEEHVFQFPAWSPDNQSIAIIGSTEHDAGLYLVHEQKERSVGVQRLYSSHTHPPIYLSWAPDGAAISLLTIHPTERLALHLFSVRHALNADEEPLLRGQPCFWHWHVDSRGLITHINLGRKSAQLAQVRWREGEAGQVQPIDIQPGNFQAPAISADGRFVAYAQMTSHGESELIVASRESRNSIGPHNGIAALGWSPTGNQLAYIHPAEAARHFYGPLHLWSALDGEAEQLTDTPTFAFFWAPNGKQIAYLTVVREPETVDVSAQGFITNGRFAGGWPFMEQRRTNHVELALHLVDVESGQNRQLTTFEPHALFVNQFLPFFDQYAKSHSIWSPASDALIIPMIVQDQPELCIVPTDGSPVRTLSEGVMATWSW